jgi:glycosyltransferase involved in cell wall biosynthesis
MSLLQVSVVIPTYNRAHLLPRSIGSALDALSPGDEVIVVDDGSTDSTAELVESYGDPVRLLRADHGGAGAARNLGYTEAHGPLVAFLDSDDEWFPGKIALQRALFESWPDLVYCCSDFSIQLNRGGERHNWLSLWMDRAISLKKAFGPGTPYSSFAALPPGRDDFSVYSGDFYLAMMRRSFIAAFTLMVRKAAAPDLRFATDFVTAEEWPAFGALTGLGPGAILDLETARQNGHDGPRLTEAALTSWADCFLIGLKQVWGADPEFLAQHGDEYRRVLTEIQLLRALGEVKAGEPRARQRFVRAALADPRSAVGLAARYGSRSGRIAKEELKVRLLHR